MTDDKQKPSEVDAQPGTGSTKPQSAEPDQSPKPSEVDAQPDKPVSNDRGAN
ncbi:hypothetical protein [Methylobacterium oxalidis]|uniref:Uncharacterized protein n=1 Tax=Methylobacterium oxalidis TaxID=944322 RepID=A0A512JAP8_9HYPH|nr:hypothetical protein [Methylobacterium oxalidis]GEP07026.1 hypothetical protein MOX02_50640 [Methylobacterium oxalidis]GJE29855.1 hypothetical protein LDDCCGHA_0017 [Methylobacterium oxalidis]GLS64622.1 hypothetical protein GCM10007888_30030 [Methylobacterium oxalidis]